MKARTFNLSHIEVCRNCKGRGVADGRACGVCRGSGMVEVRKTINFEIVPYRHGEEV